MEYDGRSKIINKMQSRIVTIDDFNYDKLSAPPLYYLLPPSAIDQLYKIAHSVRYSGNPKKKYDMIDSILKPYGFVKLSAGTNRICYKYLEDDSIVLKVAYDDVGISDNPREFMNQQIFKPFVTKIFEVSPCGTVAVAERVIPITSREEYASVADEAFELITNWFINGKYIMADIGSSYFMNLGIRKGFGVVALDYPYIYELDGSKLYCNAVDHNSPDGICHGLIDYDDGFNYLYCEKCGVKYRVNELAKAEKNNNILVTNRRKSNMKVSVMVNGSKVSVANDNDGIMKKATPNIQKKMGIKPSGSLKVSGVKPTKSTTSASVMKVSGSNRGIVRDAAIPGANTVKTPIVKAEKEPVVEFNNKVNTPIVIEKEPIEEVNNEVINTPIVEEEELGKSYAGTFSSYDAEFGLMLFKDDDVTMAINISEFPEEYKNHLIESAVLNAVAASDQVIDAVRSDLAESVKELNSLKSSMSELSIIKDELEKANSEKDNKIAALEKKLVDLEDKADDTLIEKLQKKVEELKDQLAKKDEETKSEDLTILEEKNKTIEEMSNTISELSEEVSSLQSSIIEKDKEISDIQAMSDNFEKQLKLSELMMTNYDNNSYYNVAKLDGVNTEVNASIKEDFSDISGNINICHGMITTYRHIYGDSDDTRYLVALIGDESEYITDGEGYPICITDINSKRIEEILMLKPEVVEQMESWIPSSEETYEETEDYTDDVEVEEATDEIVESETDDEEPVQEIVEIPVGASQQ